MHAKSEATNGKMHPGLVRFCYTLICSGMQLLRESWKVVVSFLRQPSVRVCSLFLDFLVLSGGAAPSAQQCNILQSVRMCGFCICGGFGAGIGILH